MASWCPSAAGGRMDIGGRRGGTTIFAVIAGALSVSGCSDGRHVSQAPSVARSSAQVMVVRTAAYPEGPASQEVQRNDPPAASLFAALPHPLPRPLPQDAGCQIGNVVTLVLSDGTTIAYGPCERPPEIDAF